MFAGYAWYLHDSPWLLAVIGALGASMMVSYTRARAEGLGIDLAGGIKQRAERIVMVAGGTMIAAWYYIDDTDTAATVLGVTMLLTGAHADRDGRPSLGRRVSPSSLAASHRRRA